ncbi:unnamed protein product [Acanthoscelides obtectus]|uniref:Uncharacterized protein n=1 Tax=Acanthoscelides obtectus TaxID=200917 RepID=A0A9P0M8S3_ACAOB|nr:unnamed protein product [Acanthoscelides obtectus]CAK1655896.1 hypothetical protein AOBTE_LOCUS19420 [Acanthoscelides obtectus]
MKLLVKETSVVATTHHINSKYEQGTNLFEGGRDITNRTNIILRRLISNNLAVRYNYFGTRQEKKAFKASFLNKVVIRAVLSGTKATKQDV